MKKARIARRVWGGKVHAFQVVHTRLNSRKYRLRRRSPKFKAVKAVCPVARRRPILAGLWASQSRSRVDRSLPPPEVVIGSIECLAREQPANRAGQTCPLTYYRLLDAFSAVVGPWHRSGERRTPVFILFVLPAPHYSPSSPRRGGGGGHIERDDRRPEAEKIARQKLDRSS